MKILDDLIDRINVHLGTNSHVKLDPALYGTQLLEEVKDVFEAFELSQCQDDNHYVYHYYAHYKQGAWTTSADGIVTLATKILTTEDYDELKKVIAVKMVTQYEIVVTELTFLGRVNDEQT